MKKLVLLISFIGVMFFINAQDSTQYVTNNNVEKLVDKYSGKVEAVIISLAESLQQPAEHVYSVLVRQQVINAMVFTSFLLLTLMFFILFIYIFKKSNWENSIEYYSRDWDNRENYNEWVDNNVYDKYASLSLIIGGLTIIFMFVGFININTILMGFMNPEYGAIKEILNLVSKL